MGYQIRIKEQAATLELQGCFDATMAAEFDRSMTALIAAGTTHITLICRNLKYTSSTGLKSLSSAAQKLRQRQGRLVIRRRV